MEEQTKGGKQNLLFLNQSMGNKQKQACPVAGYSQGLLLPLISGVEICVMQTEQRR